MTISPASGDPTAGQPYSLTCSVETVPGLVVEPSFQWTGGDVSVMDASSPILNFNQLRTSDGDRYTCSVNINPESTPVSGQAFTDLIVMSKLLCSMFVTTIVMYHIISFSTTANSGHHEESQWYCVCRD